MTAEDEARSLPGPPAREDGDVTSRYRVDPLPRMERPIFILGTQRSGTTLLRLMLDSHEDIAIGHESGFMRAIKNTKVVPDFIYGDGWYRRYGIDDDEMNRRLQAFYESIFEQYARAQGKQRWGEKTPLNIFQTDEMAAIFPDCQFVCIVRHPGAVASSLTRWRYEYAEGLDYWAKANRVLKRLTRRLPEEQVHLCRFEDLLRDPEGTLRAITDFLGVPWSERMLRHHEVQAERGTPQVVEGGTRSDQGLDASKLDAWKDNLTEQQIDLLRGDPWPLLRFFGYRARTAVPYRPIGPRRRDEAETPPEAPQAAAMAGKRSVAPGRRSLTTH